MTPLRGNDSDPLLAEFNQSGRIWFRGGLSEEEIKHLASLSALGEKPGARVDSANPLFKYIHTAGWLNLLISLWPNAEPVRVVNFNKSSDTNWGVPWHQDRVISVREKIDTNGFTNWSSKAGGWHCEPPQQVLEEMLFVRVHLDRNSAENGPMEIALGSHRNGIVPQADAARTASRYPTETCLAAPGDILVLKMLTLHRSSPSQTNAPRRALRIDFATQDLPAPLSWAT